MATWEWDSTINQNHLVHLKDSTKSTWKSTPTPCCTLQHPNKRKGALKKGKKDLVRVKNLTCCQSQTWDIHGTTALPSYSLPLYVIWALTGAGGEAVVQRVTEGAHRIRPRLAREAGGGGLVHLAAVLAALPRVCVAVTSAAAGAAVIQLVQGLQGEVERDRLVCADGHLLHGNLLLQRDRKKLAKINTEYHHMYIYWTVKSCILLITNSC